MSERTLARGQEAKIDVTVNTAGRRGRLGKTVRVYTNDPKQPVVTLMIEAQIEVPGEAPGEGDPPLHRDQKKH